MNKELEEAIKYLENLKPKLWMEYPNRFTGELKSDFILENAIQSVLNELKRLQEDYIPKDKIREKIEELEKSQHRVKNNKLIYSREDVFRFQIYILEELLGGK